MCYLKKLFCTLTFKVARQGKNENIKNFVLNHILWFFFFAIYKTTTDLGSTYQIEEIGPFSFMMLLKITTSKQQHFKYALNYEFKISSLVYTKGTECDDFSHTSYHWLQIS